MLFTSPLLHRRTDANNPADRQHSSNYRFLPEDRFRNALGWERQRSERSGNPVLLALIHFAGPALNHNGRVLRNACQSLCSVMRATDTGGWYEEGRILGLIFTDLRDLAKTDAMAKIDQRINRSLSSTVPAEAAKYVRVTYHMFPEHGGHPDPQSPVFYPEGAPHTRRVEHVVKRCMDVVVSLVLLAAFSPLLLIIAFAIKLTSHGPVLCRQTRIGAGGRRFTFLKFRSMFHNNDPAVHRDYVTRMIAGQTVPHADCSRSHVYKLVNDPRITPVGRVLRRSSLDELPQLFNVVKGEMSLVGPRPPLPYEFECYSDWHRRRVLEVKPGVTGLWQINGRCRTNFDEMVRLDLRYARQWSLWLDTQILLKTPLAVLSGVGAY